MDFKNPDYTPIFKKRQNMLLRVRANDQYLTACRLHYRYNPWDFIHDWGMTYEPRNIERDLLPAVPFVLWEKQVDYLKWLYSRWRGGKRGLVEKSRDCGVTWLSVGFAVSMWCFEPGFSIGFGSRKEDLVDRKGDFDSIFEKVRFFIDNTPREFLPVSYDEGKHAAHMRIINPVTAAAITGEAGDTIGRGGRKSIYLVDEAAFVEQQKKVNASLSQTTNCHIDISTPNGSGNEFYNKRMRWDGTDAVFVFDWRDDPRKDQEWYDNQCAELDEVTVAQELDRDYHASESDAFIPAKWVKAAIDAHKILGFEPSGVRVTGFDPADVGDAKACVNRYGSVIKQALESKSPAADIRQAIPWAFNTADEFRSEVLIFDADGMGAPTMKLSLQTLSPHNMDVKPYYGSSGVEDPDKKPGEQRRSKRIKMEPNLKRQQHMHDGNLKTNADMYLNYRAQTWSWARERFELTYQAITRAREGKLVNFDPDDLISIDSDCECLNELTAELSRPKRIFTNNGKIKVESKKDMRSRGVSSPNIAEALVMAMSVSERQERKPVLPEVDVYRPHDRGIGL